MTRDEGSVRPVVEGGTSLGRVLQLNWSVMLAIKSDKLRVLAFVPREDQPKR